MAVREAQSTGWVRSGMLYIRQERWPMRDGEVLVSVRKVYATRSPKANRYYWGGIIRPLSEHTGYTLDEMHEICKAKFLARIVEIPGAPIVAELTIGGSTRQLDGAEFGDYCKMIKEWAASWEPPFVIEDPDGWR